MASAQMVNDETLAYAVKAMEDLADEAVQVYELDKEKINVVNDLYNSLKVITAYLSFSIDLNPLLLDLPENLRITLTPDLNLLIIRPNFKSETKRFDELSLDETFNVLKYAIPAIRTMARADREIKNKKISFLREGAKKLKHLPSRSLDEMMISENTHKMEEVLDQ
jgi:hypothetical protein